LDIEEPRRGLEGVWSRITTDTEKSLSTTWPLTADQKALLIWSAKESLAKALRTGISTTLDPFAIASATCENGTWFCRHSGFPMLGTRVVFQEGLVIALTQEL
jgi:phosphopantetheinyl transferase